MSLILWDGLKKFKLKISKVRSLLNTNNDFISIWKKYYKLMFKVDL